MRYIHEEKNLIHCDIKPQNIVVGSHKDLTKCMLIDFGIAIQNNSDCKREIGNAGTYIYQPPEQMREQYNYGQKTDIWALGVSIYNLLFR